MSTSLQGLKQAMFDPRTDPLGIAVQGRARAEDFQDQLQHPNPIGPLKDPRWEGFFQAVNESAGGKPVDYAGSSGPDLGFDTNNGTMGAGTETYGPRGLRMFDADTPSSMRGLKRGNYAAG